MKSTLIVALLSLLPASLLSGCIGTDFLEEAAEFADPRIEISPEVSAVEIGAAVNFQATYFDSTEAPVSTSFQWESSNLNIAEVDENGDVTGLASGQVRITASAFGISSEQALLSVVSDPNEVAFVDVAPKDTSVIVTRTMQFSATTLNASMTLVEGQPITWRTSDDALATITDEGLVRTIEPGVVQIIAASDGIESTPINLEIFAASRTGTFRPAPGTSYTVQGQAFLEQIPGGSLQLRFAANFQSSNGPDLNVYLSTANQINSASVKLGRLQSTRGEQIYEVPSFVEMNDFDHIIIHCLPFNVTFGSAPLG